MIADATMGLADDGRRHVRCYDSGKCGWWNDPGRRSIPTSPTLPKAARHPQLEFAPHCGRPCHWSNHRSCRGQRSTGSTVTIRRFPSSAVTGKRHDPPIDYLLHYTQANRKQFNNQRKSLLARIIYHAWPHIYYGGRQSLEHRFFDLVLQRTHVVISSCVFNKPSEDVAGFYSRSLLFV